MFERLRARLHRRGFLGGVAGATAALAGCEVRESNSGETTRESADGNHIPSPNHRNDGLHPPPEYSIGVRGARHPSWLVSLCHEDCRTSATSFETVSDGPTYGLVPAPAGMVPVLRVVVTLHNDTKGEYTVCRVTTRGRRERDLDPLVAVQTDGSTTVNRLYDEVYLNETLFGTSFKGSLGDTTLQVRLRVTGGTGTLQSGSTASLVYEVVDSGTDGDQTNGKLGGGG